jgi:hypothetical protein
MAYHGSSTAVDTSTAERAQVAHAAELARMLVRHLGIDGAARTCRENHWDGVLSEVMNQTRASTTP